MSATSDNEKGNFTARSSRTAQKTDQEVKQMKENVDSLRADLVVWLKLLNDYEEAGALLAQKGEGLVDMLVSVKNKLPLLKDWQEAHATASASSSKDNKSKPNATEQQLRQQVLQQVGTVNNVVQSLKRVEGMKGALIKQTQVMLTAPMSGWLEDEINPTLQLNDELNNLETQIKKTQKDLTRYNRKKKKLKAKEQFKKTKLDGDLKEFQTKKKELRVNYILQLEDIESKAYFNLAQFLNAFMFANLSFFRQGKNVLKKLENDLRLAAKRMQGEEDEQLKIAEREKTELLDNLKKQQSTDDDDAVKDEKQGFLQWKSKTCWFSVYKGAFLGYKKPSEDIPKITLDLLLCTTKECDQNLKPQSFLIISPELELELTAPSKKEMKVWMTVIQNSIQSQLETHKKLQASKKSEQYQKMSSQGGTIGRLAPLAQLQLKDEENCKCADCSAEDPDWASINWGILMCYECSGVHRSLGTHISKVRSLTLDKWDPQTLIMMKHLGNKKVNSILEANRDPKYEKPNKDSVREVRSKYIYLKYRDKKFLSTKQTDVNQLSKDFYNCAAKVSDKNTAEMLFEMLNMLARGANINYVNFGEKNTTPLHFLAASGNLVACEFIMQNDASLSVVDIKGWTPLHYAAAHNQAGVCRLLISRGAILNLQDAQGKNAYKIAVEAKSQSASDLLADAMGIHKTADDSDDD